MERPTREQPEARAQGEGAPVALTGGCACGAVRYRLTAAPFDVGYCHCETCRRSAGAPVLVFASVPVGAFEVLHGEVRRRRSSDFGTRGFCADCGAQLTMQVDHQPGVIDFTVGSLDTPGAVAPEFHLWESRRIGWFVIADTLPRHARSRPGVAGA
jgi:hypothetical protein